MTLAQTNSETNRARNVLILLVFTFHFICINTVKGQMWHSMGQGLTNNYVADLIEFDNKIFVSGTYYSTLNSLDNIAWWNGTDWSPLGPGMLGGVQTMNVYNGELHIAGNFSSIQGCTGCKKIARWDGIGWLNLNNGITNGTVEGTAVFNSDLYVGGEILSVDSLPIKDIARWDGTNWHPVCTLSGGLSQLFCMTVFNNELYIGGYFWSINGNTMYNIAKFDGTTWSDVGGGIGGDVFAMYPDTINNRLYVSGNIVHVNNGTTPCPSNVAYWDGSVWHSVGNGPSLYPRALTKYKNELYVGFSWSYANSSGDSISGIARWDGADWRSVGGGLNCKAFTFLLNGNDLIVGGCFTQAGDSAVSLVAVWKDTTTSVIPLPEKQEKVKIIPNPFNNTAMVRLPGSNYDKFPLSFILMDFNGKHVIEKRVTASRFEISRESLVAGVYFFSLKRKDKIIYSGKVVIE